MSPLAYILALPVRGYRATFSPWVGHNCRYYPTCSAYALEALSLHGGVKGGYLTAHRICRCHPWGGSGFDPVPGSPDALRAAAGEFDSVNDEDVSPKQPTKDQNHAG